MDSSGRITAADPRERPATAKRTLRRAVNRVRYWSRLMRSQRREAAAIEDAAPLPACYDVE